MNPVPLNFSTFYYCVVKKNTQLRQYDAVSVLLLGKLRRDCPDNFLSDQVATHYISGRNPIRKNILTSLLKCEVFEIIRRFQLLGFQDVNQAVARLKRMLHFVTTLSSTTQSDLLAKANTADPYSFLAETYLAAIKCPVKNIHFLNQDDKNFLDSICNQDKDGFHAPETDTAQPPGAGSAAGTDGLSKETGYQGNQTISVHINYFSEIHDTSEIYRYLSGILNTSECFIGVNMEDIDSLIAGSKETTRFKVMEFEGRFSSILQLLAETISEKRSTAILLYLKCAESAGLSEFEAITQQVNHTFANEDTSLIFGMGFDEERESGTVYILMFDRYEDIEAASESPVQDSPSGSGSAKPANADQGNFGWWESLFSSEPNGEDDSFEELARRSGKGSPSSQVESTPKGRRLCAGFGMDKNICDGVVAWYLRLQHTPRQAFISSNLDRETMNALIGIFDEEQESIPPLISHGFVGYGLESRIFESVATSLNKVRLSGTQPIFLGLDIKANVYDAIIQLFQRTTTALHKYR